MKVTQQLARRATIGLLLGLALLFGGLCLMVDSEAMVFYPEANIEQPPPAPVPEEEPFPWVRVILGIAAISTLIGVVIFANPKNGGHRTDPRELDEEERW